MMRAKDTAIYPTSGFALSLTLALTLTLASALTSCAAPKAATPSPAAVPGAPKVLAVETFLADIAQNVAGDRLAVEALIPIGVDPHAFEPTPTDIRKVAESQVLIANGAGFESFLQKLLENAGVKRLIIEAAAGLTSRQPKTASRWTPITAETTRTSGWTRSR